MSNIVYCAFVDPRLSVVINMFSDIATNLNYPKTEVLVVLHIPHDHVIVT